MAVWHGYPRLRVCLLPLVAVFSFASVRFVGFATVALVEELDMHPVTGVRVGCDTVARLP